MPSESPFVEKQYTTAGKSYQLRPLSLFELLDLPELLVKVMESLPEGRDATPLEVAQAAKGEVKGLLARCLGIEPAELKDIPATTGMEIMADFLEMNLDENFFKALARAVAAGRQIYSSSFKS